MPSQAAELEDLTYAVIGACIEVHQSIGPGLLESVYERCVAIELAHRGLSFERQKSVDLEYRGVTFARALRADFIVEGRVVLELKAARYLHPTHEAQVRTYMYMGGYEAALLVGFHAPALRDGGVRRFTNLRLRPPPGNSSSPPSSRLP